MAVDTSIFNAARPQPFNNPFEGLGQIMQLRDQRALRDQQQQSAQALEEERRQRVQQQQQEQQNTQVLSDAYKQAFDAQTGTVNRAKLGQVLSQNGLGQALPGIYKVLDEAEEANTKAKQAKTQAEKEELEYSKIIGGQMLASDFSPTVVNGLLTVAESHGHDVAQFRQLFETQPEQFKSYVAKLVNPTKPKEDYTLGPQRFSGDTNQPIATAQAPVTAPTDYTLGNQRFSGQTNQPVATGQTPPAAPKDERLVQVMRGGVPVWVRESQAEGQPAAQAARAVTGMERQALSFYNRAQKALEDIAPLEPQIAKLGLGQQTQLQYAPNFMQSQLGQSYRQAQRAFTEARLRKESGAAINNAEYDRDAQTYFAQPGDTPKTQAQKKQARETVLEGLGYAAGKAYEEFYGEPLAKPSMKGTSNAPLVRMRAPSGQIKDVPADQVSHYQAEGAEVVK